MATSKHPQRRAYFYGSEFREDEDICRLDMWQAEEKASMPAPFLCRQPLRCFRYFAGYEALPIIRFERDNIKSHVRLGFLYFFYFFHGLKCCILIHVGTCASLSRLFTHELPSRP